ncbi:MAG: hypothetical protein HWE26_18990 [Alteromonadaceae bacterium]|nr:hypothetical protein [Alteromonadaceae bacterium]
MEEYLKSKCPDSSARNYYSEIFETNLFPSLTKPKVDKYVTESSVALFIKSVFILILLVLLFMFFVAQVYIQAFVVLDVIENPKLDEVLSNYLIFISIASLIASYILILLKLPLPEKNYSFYFDLLKLKEKDINEWEKKLTEITKRENVYTNTLLLFFGFIFFNVFSYFNGNYKSLIDSGDISMFVIVGTYKSSLYLIFLLESYRLMTILESKFRLFNSDKFKENSRSLLRNDMFAKWFKRIVLTVVSILLALYFS